MSTNKVNKKARGRFTGIPILIGIIAIAAVAIIVNRYKPTGKRMSLYEYFNVPVQSTEVLIILNNQKSEITGIYENDNLYVPQEMVEQNLNKRFYWDAESDTMLYTDDSHIYMYSSGKNEYTDDQGGSYLSDQPVLIKKDNINYVSLAYIRERSDFTYTEYDEPHRVVINGGGEVNNYVTAEKNSHVRYRGGVKSPILEDVNKADRLIYRKNVDEWVEVQTQSGVIGYIQAKYISDSYQEINQSGYADNFSSIRKDYKISLVWFQVGGTAGNAGIDNLLAGTSGINTISPTWYAITDNSGSMNCFASKDVVSRLHSAGYEVWPLVNDFADGVTSSELFGSRAARTRMIRNLIADANNYGYDGINIDFEKVNKEGARDFLQFIRELSVECQRNNLVLSIDNYKAEVYNSHYDMAEQSAYADYIILMGYDEHYAGSASGSVASIGFVEDGIQKALKQVPKEKLINAMPFYTRIWTEKDGKTTSTAVGMQAAIDDLSKNGAPAIWDETVGQYFGSYEKNNSVVKIWVEEDRSIEEKLKLYQKYDLAGVAGWKLGLEKKSVWSVISKYINQ